MPEYLRFIVVGALFGLAGNALNSLAEDLAYRHFGFVVARAFFIAVSILAGLGVLTASPHVRRAILLFALSALAYVGGLSVAAANPPITSSHVLSAARITFAEPLTT